MKESKLNEQELSTKRIVEEVKDVDYGRRNSFKAGLWGQMYQKQLNFLKRTI